MASIDEICLKTKENIKKEFEKLIALMDDSKVEINSPEPDQQLINGHVGKLKVKKKRDKQKKYPLQAAAIFTNIESIIERTCNILDECNKEAGMERIDSLCNDLKKLNNRYKTYITGSRALGLCDSYGDMDVFLDIGGMYKGNKYQHIDDQDAIVRDVAKKLRTRSKTWKEVYAVTTARTPIVKAFHIPSELYCDISFRCGLGDVNTMFIKHMMERVPALRPMIVLLKHWSYMTKLDNHFRSYFLTVMIIFYLQIRNILPSIAKMRSLNKGQPIYVLGWECHYYNCDAAFADLIPPPCYVRLLHGFFDYYGNVFKFDNQVVCPLLGRTIQKSDFEQQGKSLPDEMLSYKYMVNQFTTEERNESKLNTYLVSHPHFEIFRHNAPVCVQDPFDLSHNLTKAVPENIVATFQKFCLTQAENLKVLVDKATWQPYDSDFWRGYFATNFDSR